MIRTSRADLRLLGSIDAADAVRTAEGRPTIAALAARYEVSLEGALLGASVTEAASYEELLEVGGDDVAGQMFPIGHEDDPDESRQDHLAVRAALGQLRPNQRRVLEARFGFGGRAPVTAEADIADAVGLTVGEVRSALQSGKKALRGILLGVSAREADRMIAAGVAVRPTFDDGASTAA